MAIKQSKFFKGNARSVVTNPARAGQVIEHLFTHTFDEDVADTDILELFPLQDTSQVVEFAFATEGMGAEALDIGLMSGTSGSKDDTRTSGDEMIDGVGASAGGAMTLTELANLPRIGNAITSIGVKTATTITAGSAKKLHVRLRLIA